MSNLYHKKFDIAWPKELIKSYALEAEYKRGHDSAGILWPVDEAGVEEWDWVLALEDFTGVYPERMFFSRVHHGGLPIHRDHGRQCALNFPVTGDFENSMNIFVDDFDQIVEQFNGEEPTLINTRQLHGVINKTSVERIVLTVSFYQLFNEVKNMKFNNNEVFYVRESTE